MQRGCKGECARWQLVVGVFKPFQPSLTNVYRLFRFFGMYKCACAHQPKKMRRVSELFFSFSTGGR